MAVPKKKISQSRRDMRRYSNRWKLEAVHTVACSHCSGPVRPHCICDNCGYYSKRLAIHPQNGDV